MNGHHDSFVNFPLAVVWLSMPWWIHLFEDGSYLAGKMIPYIGVFVGILQVIYLLRKNRRL